MIRIGAIALLLVTAGCGSPSAEADNGSANQTKATAERQEVAEPEEKIEVSVERFELLGQTYVVPAAHIMAMREEPRFFVRIKPPDAAFTLVYDSRSDGVKNPGGVPRIFSVNDGEYPQIDYYSGPQGIVVCRRASAPKGGCGMSVRHGDADWSVLFPPASREVAGEIADRAKAALDDYREASEAAPPASETTPAQAG